MALKDVWNNVTFSDLENKLIYLNVGLDSFVVRTATIEEATKFWEINEPSIEVNLDYDVSTNGLVNIDTTGIEDVPIIGGKASNFAELKKIQTYYSQLDSIPLPECSFAIPFSYYQQHIIKNKIDSVINVTLSDSLFLTDIAYKQSKLQYIQSLIKKAPIDTLLVNLVKAKILKDGGSFTYFRFRSSTNTEDIEDFNGAGLYDSYTGSLTDPDKPIDKAIKKVWASLWNYGAFEEREYFKINHKTVQMGILVHRSFPSEEANGVVITSIIYNRPELYYPGVTINAQFGESSITNPDGNYIPDQIICYTFSLDNESPYIIEYLRKSNVPGMGNQSVLTNDEIYNLTDLCRDINLHYYYKTGNKITFDVEFKVDMVDGKRKLYIKQARPY